MGSAVVGLGVGIAVGICVVGLGEGSLLGSLEGIEVG